MNSDNKLLIFLYSDSNFLALNILENLLSKNCSVNVVTNDVRSWQERTLHIANRSRFSIIEKSNFNKDQKGNYNIYCGGFLSKIDTYNSLKEFIRNENQDNIKTLILLPFEIFNSNENSEILVNDNISIIYLGDLLGPRLDLESDLLVSSAINEVLINRTLTLGVGEIFYPLFIGDVIKTITKWLFSFGPYGKEIFLLGNQISGTDFWEENQRIVPEIKIIYDSEAKVRFVPRGYEIKTLASNLKFSLLETYKWLSSVKTKPVQTRKVKTKESSKPKKVITYPKFLPPLIITLATIALIPLLTLTISAGSFFISYKEFVWGQDNRAENLLLMAKTFSVLTKEESNLLSYIPVFGRAYKEISFAGSVGERSSDIAISSLPMIKTSSEFFNKILGNNIYDPTILSQSLKSGLGAVYQSLSLLQVDTQTSADNGILLAGFLQSRFNFERYRNLVVHTENMTDKLPNILGKDGSKTYLLLFQNNMELRPTGGFIGSYGLITFDGGRMSDLTVSDVYSADGQLNGHVEPPSPIKNYLGEANWWLRDSNWDPDFPTSAKRSEWFLDKEVARKVDGVIAVDLQPIKDILKYTGPIFLPDFNLDITDANLYEKTQSEVQDNFFPGTHKKASFLTALSRNLISEVGKLDGTRKTYILKSFFDNLEGRHVQIYLHDADIQNDLSALQWDGSISTPDCKDKCFADFVGVVEANLGVNKANYFITRKTDININLTPTEVDHRLTLSLKNSANPALDLAGKYKAYIRILIPSGSEVLSVKSITGQSAEILSPETTELKGRKEVGVLVDVLGGQSEKLEFSWRTLVSGEDDIDSYGFYVRKQAGVGDDPLAISIDSNGVQLKSSPKFALTKGGVYTYNTTLGRDFFSHASWTKKF